MNSGSDPATYLFLSVVVTWCSWSWVLSDGALDALLVFYSILLEKVVRLSLRRRVWIRIVEEVLNSERNLLDSDSGFPALVLVQDRETHSAGWIDVGVEERRCKFAYRSDRVLVSGCAFGE